MTLVLFPFFFVAMMLAFFAVIPLGIVAFIGFASGCWEFDPTSMFGWVVDRIDWWREVGDDT